MKVTKVSKGKYLVENNGRDVTIEKDRYMGGWIIWSSPFKYSDERFMSKKSAVEYLERIGFGE